MGSPMRYSLEWSQAAWCDALVVVSLAAMVIVTAALVIQRYLHGAAWRRGLWQAAFATLALMVVAEVTGLAAAATHWLRSAAPVATTAQVSAPADVQPRAAADAVYDGAFVNEAMEPAAVPAIEPTAPAELIEIAPAFSPETTAINESIETATAPWPWIEIGVGLYLAVVIGLLLHLAWGALRLWQFRRRLVWISLPAEEQAWLNQRLGCCPPLAVHNAISSPLAFGLVRPAVVVPVDFFERFSLIERRVMLAHEVAHVAGSDPLWRLLAEVVSRLLWFHPAVWIARGHLVTATEQAADEASLLVEDGPDVLAQCLVDLGRRLQPGHGLGWLGIAAGFRSALGRRVERLLDLDARDYQPPAAWRRPLLVLASTMAVLAVIFGTTWARSSTPLNSGEKSMNAWERSWRHSLAGLALVTFGGTAATADDANRPQQPLAVALNFDDEREREGDGPPRPERPRDGDGPRREGPRDGDGPRRPGPPREGDRPRPDGPSREGARPDGPPREGERPRPDGPPREGARPDGPRREGEGPGPRGPQGEVHRRIQHILQAAANLDAAGMSDQAAALRTQARRLAQESGVGPGDRPRPDGPPREGDRPRPEGPPREGDRPRADGPPREGDRPRPDGPPREGDRPRPDGPREGGPGSPDELRALIRELRGQVENLRREVGELRGKLKEGE